MNGMKSKINRMRELCSHGEKITRSGVSMELRDLFTKIDVNLDILEDIIESHFDVYHSGDDDDELEM